MEFLDAWKVPKTIEKDHGWWVWWVWWVIPTFSSQYPINTPFHEPNDLQFEKSFGPVPDK